MERGALGGRGGVGFRSDRAYVGALCALQGIEHIDIIDPDTIEGHNLNRQYLYHGKIGEYKVDVMSERIKDISPSSIIRKKRSLLGSITKNDWALWLNKFKESDKQFYSSVRKETENFKEIKPEILVVNPQKILIFRLALGMSQNKFEEFLGNRNKNITKYETGKIKTMQLTTAKNITERIREVIKPVSLSKVLQQFRRSKQESQGWFKAHKNSLVALKARRKGAIESLKKRRTPQEKLLEEELTKKKMKVLVNYPLSERIIVDFYLPEKNLIIECKEIQSKSKRENKEQLQKLAYQGFRIRFKLSDKKVWALVKLGVKFSKDELMEFKEPFEKFFIKIEDLLNAL